VNHGIFDVLALFFARGRSTTQRARRMKCFLNSTD
jgi:hypothetical protein